VKSSKQSGEARVLLLLLPLRSFGIAAKPWCFTSLRGIGSYRSLLGEFLI
jgi:hypothetical protein